MANASTYIQNGKKQQLSDLVDMLDVSKTPFYSMIGVEKIKGATYEWVEDSLDTSDVSALVEGGDVVASAYHATTPHVNYTQIFSKAFKLTGSAAEQALAGNKSELSRQRMNTAKELKIAVEKAFLSAEVGTIGSASTARKTGGFASQLDSEVIVTNGGAVSEQLIEDMLIRLYEFGGEPTVLMASPRLISAVAKVLKAERMSGVNNDTTVNGAVAKYISNMGEVTLVANRYAPAGNLYFIDPTKWKREVFRDWKRDELAKTGDSMAEMIVAEMGLKNTCYKGSGLITGVTTGEALSQ